MQWNNRKSNHSNRSVWSSGRRNKETTTCPACHATQYNEKVKKKVQRLYKNGREEQENRISVSVPSFMDSDDHDDDDGVCWLYMWLTHLFYLA